MKAEAKAEAKANKQPRTIKVKTVVISVMVAIAIIVSFIGGWTMKSVDQARVNAEAQNLASQMLKSDVQK